MHSRILVLALVLLIIASIVLFFISHINKEQKNPDNINSNTNMDQNDVTSNFPANQEDRNSYDFPEPNQAPFYYAKVGEEFEVQDFGQWSVKFLKVLSDTRCPLEKDCHHGGSARVQIQIIDKQVANEQADIVELEVSDNVRFPAKTGKLPDGGYQSVTVQRSSLKSREINWFVALRDLVPYPSSTGAPESSEYLGLFQVRPFKR